MAKSCECGGADRALLLSATRVSAFVTDSFAPAELVRRSGLVPPLRPWAGSNGQLEGSAPRMNADGMPFGILQVVPPCQASSVDALRVDTVNAYMLVVEVGPARQFIGPDFAAVAQGLADQLMSALAYFQYKGFESARINWRFASLMEPRFSPDPSIQRFRSSRRLPGQGDWRGLGARPIRPNTAPALLGVRRGAGIPGGGTEVASASDGSIALYLDGTQQRTSTIRGAAAGDTPLVAHEFFHLIQMAYAPSLDAALRLPEQALQNAEPSYLRWFSEGMATAAAVSKYFDDLGPGTGYDPAQVRAAQSVLQDQFPDRNWRLRLDGPYLAGVFGLNSQYSLGALFYCGNQGNVQYFRSLLCGAERWLAANAGPNLLQKLVRGEFLENVVSLFGMANITPFQSAAIENVAGLVLSGFDAAFARTILAVGRYRGPAQKGGDDQRGNRMWEVDPSSSVYTDAGGYWPVGGEATDELSAATSVSRAYFPRVGVQGSAFEFELPQTWPEGFVLIVSEGSNDDERRARVLRARGSTLRIQLQGITAANPVHVSVLNLRVRSGVNAFSAIRFEAFLRVIR